MLERIVNKIKELQFEPSIIGIFINPLYIARSNLFKKIKKLSIYISGKTLDVGCGQKPYEKLFIKSDKYIGIDIENSGHDHNNSKVDIFYDGKRIPFPDNNFDSIVSNQVFEHIFEPKEFLNEIFRVLKNNGILLLTIPFVWDEHEQPFDYARYTSFGIKDLLGKNNFEIIHFEKTVNSIALIFQLINLYIYKLIMRKGSIIRFIICLFFTVPNNILGTLLSHILPKNNDLYLDNIIIARKKSE